MTPNLRWLIGLALVLSLAAGLARSAEPRQYQIEMKIGEGQCNGKVVAEPVLLTLAGQIATFEMAKALRLEVEVEPRDSQHIQLRLKSVIQDSNHQFHKGHLVLAVRPGQWVHQRIGHGESDRAIAWVDLKVTEVENQLNTVAQESGEEAQEDLPEPHKCKIAVPTWFWLGQLAWALLEDEDFSVFSTLDANPQDEEVSPSGIAQPTPYVPQTYWTPAQGVPLPGPVPLAVCPSATLPPWNRPFESFQMEMPAQLVGVNMPPGGAVMSMPPLPCPVPLCYQGAPCSAPPMQMCTMLPPPPPSMLMACAPPSSITTIHVVQEKGRHQMVVHHEANDLKMLVEQMEVKMAEGPPLKVTVTKTGEIEASCSEMKAYAQSLTVEGKERIVLEGKVTIRQGKHAGDEVIRTSAEKSGTAVSAEKVILYLNDGHLEIPLPRMGKEKADKAVGPGCPYSGEVRQGCTCTCP